MCWSINWYSDKPPFSLNVLIRLILSPKLCSWEVSAMSSRLSPAHSPAHVEIIGLNTFAASSAPQHQVSIGLVGKWVASNAKRKRGGGGGGRKKGKKKRGGLLLQCKVKHHLKRSVWEWEQRVPGMPILQCSFPAPSRWWAATSTCGVNSAGKKVPSHPVTLSTQRQPHSTGLRTQTWSWSYLQEYKTLK